MSPREFFEGLGFKVVGTGGGCEALATSGWHDDKPHVLITAADDACLPDSWDNIAIGCYETDGKLLGFVSNQSPSPAVADKAIAIADEASAAHVESETLTFLTLGFRWWDVSAVEPQYRQSVADSIAYLDSRSLLTRHPTNYMLLRLADAEPVSQEDPT